jgi:hypothetical protein
LHLRTRAGAKAFLEEEHCRQVARMRVGVDDVRDREMRLGNVLGHGFGSAEVRALLGF